MLKEDYNQGLSEEDLGRNEKGKWMDEGKVHTPSCHVSG